MHRKRNRQSLGNGKATIKPTRRSQVKMEDIVNKGLGKRISILIDYMYMETIIEKGY